MFIIAGNKLDLESHRRVHEATAADLARRFECPYVEISACTGEGMNAFGRAIIKCARQFISNQLLQAKEGVALHPESHTEGCNC
jgi:Fe2+ transport system protein B